MLEGLVLPIAWVASPLQWVVLAAVVVAILAPTLLPALARAAGRLAALTFGRTAGRTDGATRVEVIPPDRPGATLRSSNRRPLGPDARRAADAAGRARQGGDSSRPNVLDWRVPGVVLAAIGVLLWWLLHAR